MYLALRMAQGIQTEPTKDQCAQVYFLPPNVTEIKKNNI